MQLKKVHICLVELGRYLIYLINAVYAGRFGDAAKLAGVGLGTTFLNIICLIPLRGVNGAQDTFTSQAYRAGEL